MRKITLVSVLLVVVILALGPSPTTAAGTKKYVHESLGFSMRLFSDWTETPVRVDFKSRGVVAKFKAESRGGDFATLDVYRYAPDLTETTPDGAADGQPADPDEAIRRAIQAQMGASKAKNAEEAVLNLLASRINMINRNANRMPNVGTLEPILVLPKPKKVRLGKQQGEVYLFEVEHPDERRFSFFLMAGIARRGEEEYLLTFSSSWSQRKKYRNGFYGVIRSFRFPGEDYEAEADEEEEEDWDKDAELLDPAKRARFKKDLIATWRTLNTPHYMILYHAKDLSLAKAIAKRIERLRKRWEEDFPPVKPITAAMIIRCCPDFTTYRHYGAPGGSGGYWSSRDDEFVFPCFGGRSKADDKTMGVLHHEGWHQYFHYALEGRPSPIAMNEGLAEYYFCAKYVGRGRFKIGDRHPMRHSTVKTAASTGALVPVGKFLRLTQREHYSRAQLCYSEGWALFYWLMRGTRDEQYKKIPYRLFEELAKSEANFMPGSESWRAAVDKALEGIDEDKLHQDFLRGIKKVL